MIKKVFHTLNSTIGGGAILIAFFGIASKVVGLYRDRLFAGTFGASRLSDIYFASFKLPDLVFNILVLGALTSSFIPVFQKTWHKNNEQGILLSNAVLNILLIAIGIFTILVWLCAPIFVPYLVPGFGHQDIALTITMTRYLLASLLFFTASNLLSGVLNAWKRFFSFGLSSVLYNVGIIIGIVYCYPVFGMPGLAIGVVGGAAMHFLVQAIEAYKNGWRYKPVLFYDASVKRIMQLMIPRMVGLAGNQIAVVVVTILASTLSAGSLAVFNYANNLQSIPIGIFGISLAVAAFPYFSKSLSENDDASFRKMFSVQCRRILYFLIPISFSLLLLRAQIVRVILGTGAFDWNATHLTAQALGFFSLAICAQGLVPLLARSFYALEDTVTPVVVSFVDIGATIILSLLLLPNFGVLGLVFADAIGGIGNMLVLFILLHRRFGDLDDTELARSIMRISAVSLVASALMYLSLQYTARLLDTHTFIGIFTQGAVSGSIGIAVYVLLSMLLGFDEIHSVKRYILKFLRPLTAKSK